MEYRKLPKGEEQISVLGLGTSSIGMAEEKEIDATIHLALENGINYFDLAAADAAPFAAFGQTVAGNRDKYRTGKYGWTTDLETIKRSVDWQLKELKTDYIDFGFLHCIDEEEDLERVMFNGVLDYIEKLKKENVLHHIGLSTHTPSTADRMLDTCLLDMMMFSINPAYDYQQGDYGLSLIHI